MEFLRKHDSIGVIESRSTLAGYVKILRPACGQTRFGPLMESPRKHDSIGVIESRSTLAGYVKILGPACR